MTDGTDGTDIDDSFEVEVVRTPSVELRLRGDLDVAAVDRLGQAVAEVAADVDGAGLLLDLAEVAFCDSSGITALVRARSRVGRLRLRAASPAVRRVLEINGLERVFELVD